jgi:hypothetical protein
VRCSSLWKESQGHEHGDDGVAPTTKYLYVFILMVQVEMQLLTGAGQSWQLVFAMALTGTVFFVWVMIMAYQVFVNS